VEVVGATTGLGVASILVVGGAALNDEAEAGFGVEAAGGFGVETGAGVGVGVGAVARIGVGLTAGVGRAEEGGGAALVGVAAFRGAGVAEGVDVEGAYATDCVSAGHGVAAIPVSADTEETVVSVAADVPSPPRLRATTSRTPAARTMPVAMADHGASRQFSTRLSQAGSSSGAKRLNSHASITGCASRAAISVGLVGLICARSDGARSIGPRRRPVRGARSFSSANKANQSSSPWTATTSACSGALMRRSCANSAVTSEIRPNGVAPERRDAVRILSLQASNQK